MRERIQRINNDTQYTAMPEAGYWERIAQEALSRRHFLIAESGIIRTPKEENNQ